MTTSTQNVLIQCSRIAFFVAVLFLPSLAISQTVETGSIEYLKSSNGFKDIKLGANISDIPAQQLTYMDDNSGVDADSCVSYIYHNDDALKADSDMQYQQIGLRVYKGRIVNIYLFFNVKDSYKVLRNFLKDYGQFTELPKEYAHIYNWNTVNVGLSLAYEAKVETGVAIFTSNPIAADIKEMKDRQRFVESLASMPVDPQHLQAVRELNPAIIQKSPTQ